MADFPKLKTGAVMQYPARKKSSYRTHVVRFLDGSEQRYRESTVADLRWVLVLDKLDEQEAAALEAFFQANHGVAGSFTFHDPWVGTDYADCSLENTELKLAFQDTGRCSTALVVRQNRS